MMNRIFGMTSSKAAIVALLCGVSALVTGCTTSQFLSGTDMQPVTGSAISGVVHGGQNPVTTATIQLWTVGTGSYGAAASKLGASVQTNSLGGFTLGAYTCPSASTQTYITSSGGNPGLGTGTNANIMLATALGNCGNLNSGTFITINEVTTAATAYALGQYFTPAIGGASSADSFGAPSTTQAQTGIANAMATVTNLVTNSTGTAVTSATATGAAGSLTITPESAKLNTIADILASCVNSAGGTAGDSSNCGMLFDGVVSATGAVPTDTLQAAVYLSLNPTSKNSNTDWPTSTTCTNNLCVLYGLASSNPPFVGVGTQPTDWTVGIQYSGPAVVATTVLNAPLDLRADSAGNIWAINVPSSSSSASESLVELSPTGAPLVNPWNGGTTGGTSMGASTPRNLAIDLNGNVWVTSSSGSAYVYQWNPTSSTGVSLNLGSQSYGLAIDANDNVFIGHGSTGTTTSLEEFTNGVLASTNRIEYAVDGTAGSPNVLGEYAAVDTAGNVWLSNAGGSTSATGVVEVTGLNGVATCTTFPCTPTNDSSLTSTYTAVTGGSQLEPYGMAANVASMWLANAGSGANSVTSLALTGGTGTNYGSVTSLNSPHYVAVDGSGNVWVANKTSSPGSVAEFSNAGTILSPQSGTIGFSHASIATAEGITIDPSGNVWIANDIAATASVGASVFELVGAASPTVTPIALALKNGTVGVKP
jgi:hypothetical protein